jgi:hypothetical protein
MDRGPVVRLHIEHADSRGASLAASGTRVVAVWAATAGGETNIYSSVSDDAGLTFGEPVRVNDVDGDARVNGEQPPRVAVGRDIVVAWQTRRTGVSQILAARSVDGGRSFQHAAAIHSETLTGARGWSSVVLDGDGAAHIAWLDGRNAANKAAPMYPGAAHVHAEPTRQDIFQVTLRPDGTREEASVATNVCFCCKTSIATGPGASLYVVWRHIYPTNLRDMAVAASVDGGRTFTAPVRVSEDGWQLDGCPEDGPSIAADATGILHIVWPTIVDKNDGTRKGVFYSFSRDGGRTFAPRVRVDVGGDVKNASHPQITAAGERMAIVWDESAETGPRARARWIESPSTASDSAPRLSQPLTVSDPGPASYPSVTSTAGAMIAAWTVNSVGGSEIQVRRLLHRH